MMKMITAVVMVDGRCRFIKLHELSTDVEFWILSATSFVGEGGGREAGNQNRGGWGRGGGGEREGQPSIHILSSLSPSPLLPLPL